MKIGDRVKVRCQVETIRTFLFFSKKDFHIENLWGKILKMDEKENDVLIEWENSPFPTSSNWVEMRDVMES